MLDTVTIRVPYNLCVIRKPEDFSPPATFLGKHAQCVLQRPAGVYIPNVTIVSYFNHSLLETCTELCITFSVPKLMFDNNLQEVNDDDFQSVIERLQAVLSSVGVEIPLNALSEGKIKNVHFSKNILLNTSIAHMAINTLSQGNYRRLKKSSRDYANNGKKLTFGANSYEICFYDKSKEVMAEYRKMKNDERKELKRSVINSIKGKQILRMEVRLNSIRKIKNLFFSYNILKHPGETKLQFLKKEISFREIFQKNIARKVCIGYFKMIKATINIEQKLDFADVIKHILQDKNLKTGKCFSNIGALYVRELLGREFVENKSAKKLREAEKIMMQAKNLLNISSVTLAEFESKLYNFELLQNLTTIKSSKGYRKAVEFEDVKSLGSKVINPNTKNVNSFITENQGYENYPDRACEVYI